jgi:hypothetical protein
MVHSDTAVSHHQTRDASGPARKPPVAEAEGFGTLEAT